MLKFLLKFSKLFFCLDFYKIEISRQILKNENFKTIF